MESKEWAGWRGALQTVFEGKRLVRHPWAVNAALRVLGALGAQGDSEGRAELLASDGNLILVHSLTLSGGWLPAPPTAQNGFQATGQIAGCEPRIQGLALAED